MSTTSFLKDLSSTPTAKLRIFAPNNKTKVRKVLPKSTFDIRNEILVCTKETTVVSQTIEAYYFESADIADETNELKDLDVKLDVASTCIGVL